MLFFLASRRPTVISKMDYLRKKINDVLNEKNKNTK